MPRTASRNGDDARAVGTEAGGGEEGDWGAACSNAAYSKHTAPTGTERKTDMKPSPENDHEATNRNGGFHRETERFQAIGGRSNEPGVAGSNPEEITGNEGRASILAMEDVAVAGNITVWAQAQ
jgi:hypothetical protein